MAPINSNQPLFAFRFALTQSKHWKSSFTLQNPIAILQTLLWESPPLIEEAWLYHSSLFSNPISCNFHHQIPSHHQCLNLHHCPHHHWIVYLNLLLFTLLHHLESWTTWGYIESISDIVGQELLSSQQFICQCLIILLLPSNFFLKRGSKVFHWHKFISDNFHDQ